MNASDAALTGLATAQTGSRVHNAAPSAPAGGGSGLIIGAVAGSALGSSGAPYTRLSPRRARPPGGDGPPAASSPAIRKVNP